MSIPSSDAFREYMDATADVGHQLLFSIGLERGWEPDADQEVDDVEKLLSRYFAEASLVGRKFDALEVGRWFGSRNFDRAWMALHGRRMSNEPRDPSPHEYAQRMFQAVSRPVTADHFSRLHLGEEEQAQRLMEANSPAGMRRRLGRRLVDYCSRNWMETYRSVVAAFNAYFHGGDHLKYAERYELKAQRAQKLLDALAELESEELLSGCGIHSLVRVSSASRRTLEDLVRNVGAVEAPLRRIDGTARERALAFELWLAFRRFFRANKSNAIYEFLLVEGVDRPPASLKQVQEWVKRWNDGNANKYPVSLPRIGQQAGR